jgi:hypothetical protein
MRGFRRCFLAIPLAAAGIGGLSAWAQTPPAPDEQSLVLPPHFDVAVVGYHALGIEQQAVNLTWWPVDRDIAQVETLIATIKTNIELWRGRLANTRQDVDGWIDRSTAEAAIAQEQESLSEAEARREALLKERDHLRQCLDAEERINLWQELIAESEDLIAVLEYSDKHEIPNQRRLIEEARGYIAALVDACVDRGQLIEGSPLLTDAIKRAYRDLGDYAQIARKGLYSDLPLARAKLTRVLVVQRQLALLGHSEESAIGESVMAEVRGHMRALASSCEGQSFAVREGWGLERQSQLIGSGADFDACLYRLYEAGRWDSSDNQGEVWRACIKWPPGYGPEGAWRAKARNHWYEVEGVATIERSGSGQFELAGKRAPQDPAVGKMNIKGEVRLARNNAADKLGRVDAGSTPDPASGIPQWRYAFVTTETILSNKYRGKRFSGEYTMPAGPAGGSSLPIRTINGNKPCDPSVDVWSYPSEQP